jgi:dTDP-4-amino-4,6-dideoxygalactose transaminase
LGDAERSAALRVLSQPRLTGGPERARFEGLLAKFAERKHALAVSSGTAALELALAAREVGPGQKVLVTAFGFPAAASAVVRRGAEVVAVDVDLATWTIDFARARELCDETCAALVTIDQLGAVTESRDIESFERDTGVSVISDAACGFGGTDSSGRAAGCAGLVASFSFHPRKLITTGEGGALVTDDAELHQRLVALHNHGQLRAGEFSMPGTNARLDELSCAIGCAQLARLDAMLAERELLASGYRERLGELRAAGALSWQVVPPGARHAYQTFAVLLREGVDRSAVIARLGERDIESGPATYSFAELPIYDAGTAAVAASLHQRGLALPLFLGMRSSELDRVAEALSEVLK